MYIQVECIIVLPLGSSCSCRIQQCMNVFIDIDKNVELLAYL